MVSTSPPEGPDGSGPAAEGDGRLLERVRSSLAPEFEVSRYLGEESFGSLFLAREVALRRAVVVKVLSREHARSPEIRRRFEREMLAVARISHPNVVPIFRVGALEDGTPYYVEPYLGECTLTERLEALRRFEPAQVRHVMRDISAALAAAHRLGIVHRGVHPGALRCEEASARVLLTDFGLSGLMESFRSDDERLTPSGAILGSAGYMSPEQMRGQTATDRSDIYALGLVAWKLLTGGGQGFPSPEATADGPWRAWEEAVGDPPLTDLIHRCLAPDPKARPSAQDVVAELSLGDEEPRPGGADRERLWAGIRRRRIPHALLIYLPSAWVVLQVVDQLVQQRLLGRWIYLLTLITALAGLPASLVLTWHHGARGAQRVTPAERWMLAAIAVAWAAAVLTLWARA